MIYHHSHRLVERFLPRVVRRIFLAILPTVYVPASTPPAITGTTVLGSGGL